MANEMNSSLEKAALTAAQVREELFAAGQAALQSDDVDLDTVDEVFSAIKEAEVLRRHISDILDRGTQLVPVSLKQRAVRKREKQGPPKYYLRDDGAIVRTGFGSTGKYEHVVKENDFYTIIGVLNGFAGPQGFSIDDVLKKLRLPSYLTYTVVGLLKDHLGLIDSPKRGQYKFHEDKLLEPASIIERLRNEGGQ